MAGEIHDFLLYQDVYNLKAEVAALKEQRGGSISESMDAATERELVNQKIAASEARSDAKFARLDGKLDLIASSISNLRADTATQRSEERSRFYWTIGTILGTAVALLACFIAVVTYGAATFYNGTVMREAVHQEVQGALPRPDASGK